MNHGRHSIRILGLSLFAMFNVMGLTAVAAQAVEFRVEGGTFTAKGVASETLTGTFPLVVLLFGAGLELHCSSGDIESAVANLGGTGSTAIIFLGCTVVGIKFCTVYKSKADMEGAVNKGQILFGSNWSLVLHAGSHYLKAESANFGTIFMGGAGCILPKENVVSGSTALSLPRVLENLVEQPVVPINAATEALLGVQLKHGAEKVSLHGSQGLVSLAGLKKGKTWGAE